VYPLEHVPKKLLAFFEEDMLQLFDFERVLADHWSPFDRDARWCPGPNNFNIQNKGG
jgi:hypothetical protein